MKFFSELRIASFFSLLLFITFSVDAQTTSPTPPIQEEDQVVKVESRLVVVPVSVTNAAGDPVLGLKATDFRISEENRPQTIDSLGNADNVPLEIAILFDVSASADSMFKFQQETAAKFLQEVLRAEDRATIFTVGEKPVLVQERETAERSQIGIRSITPKKEQTAFYDSVRVAAEHLGKNAPKGRRKVIVVISDGEDTNSDGVLKAIWDAEKKIAANVQGQELRTLRVRARDTAAAREQVRVLKALQDADTVFYSINPGGSSLQLNKISQFGQENMQKFADDTGGTAYLPKFQPIDTKDELANTSNVRKNTATLEGIFKQLANELRAQYLIQYYSDSEFPNQKYVKLSLGLTNPANHRVRARQGYYVKD
jgi:VWFA-related protein